MLESLFHSGYGEFLGQCSDVPGETLLHCTCRNRLHVPWMPLLFLGDAELQAGKHCGCTESCGGAGDVSGCVIS